MKCLHMSGAGNDFMVMDVRGQELELEALALSLCEKFGTDGFMALDRSEVADFRMHFYNSDGTRGEMCGNGARCICRFAYDLGIAPEEMTVQTDAGLVYGWRNGPEDYTVQLNDPGAYVADALPGVDYVELGDPGVPHSVELVENLDIQNGEEYLQLALSRRNDPVFPKGVNVNFYCPKENGVDVLTYERGVEDYTLACGTGCSSVAVSLWLRGSLPGGRLIANCRGGTLTITVKGEKSEVTQVLLTGPATVLAEYEV